MVFFLEIENDGCGFDLSFQEHPADDPAGTGATDGVWRDPDWLLCRDGRWRPVEPGTFPLADGIPGRMGLLRGYGNAIVPPLAAEFVTAFMESLR